MIITENRENENNEDGEDDFTDRDFVDTVRQLWELLLNFYTFVQHFILLIIAFYKKIISKSTICAKCTRGLFLKKSPTRMSIPSTARSFKSLTKSYRSKTDHRVRNLHNIRRNDASRKETLEDQLNDLLLLDSNMNNNDVDSTNDTPASSQERFDEKKNIITQNDTSVDTERKKKDEIEPFKVAQYREAILKYSQITFSDFTSLFNKFVRENGRDFSKADLLHWFSRFTKFIYLKKEISGEPEDVREQMSFRAIQSKRDSLVERLYTLRETNEINLSLEEFCENLMNCHINPIKKILKVIKGGAGDMNMIQQEKNMNENIISIHKLDDGNNFQNEKDNNVSLSVVNNISLTAETKSSAEQQKSNTTRKETFDLETEKVSESETGNEPVQQTTTQHRQKKTPTSKKTLNNSERKKCLESIDFENLYHSSNFQTQILNENPPPQRRDRESCLSSNIYSTTNGYIKVSQYLDNSVTTKLENAPVFQQCRSISFYVDHVDKTDPLPEGTEIKPLPPGGVEEVLRTGSRTTDKEFAEIERLRSLYENENQNESGTAKETSVTTTAPNFENSIFNDQPKVLAKELNATMTWDRNNLFKDILDYSPQKTQLSVEIPSPKDIKFDFASPGAVNPFLPQVNTAQKHESKSLTNIAQSNKDKKKDAQPVKKSTDEEHDHNMRRSIPVRRRQQKALQGREAISKEKQTKEAATNEINKNKSAAPLDICKKGKEPNNTIIANTVAIKDSINDERQKNAKIKNETQKDKKIKRDKYDRSNIQEMECKYSCSQSITSPRKTKEQQIFEQLPPLNFIDTDKTENEAAESTQEPTFLEMNATVDYSRHVVEPSHGDRPNKKKLQSRIKEKIKTKGEANKHLKVKKEKPAYFYEEGDIISTVEDGKESELEDSMTEQNEDLNTSSTVVYAADQPQILDNREYMMVPEEIIRITDPRLKDIEDKYTLSLSPDKKDKKKRKDKKGKAPKSIPIALVSDFHP